MALARGALFAAAGALAVAWLFLLSAPGSPSGHYNSDAAIPVLMANAERVNPFYLFYLGQDRFGAWPFLFGWIVHRLTGLHWSPELLHALLLAGLVAAAWCVRALAGRWGTALAAAFLAVLVLHPEARTHVLDLSQPYAWQLSALCFAWWSTRGLGEAKELKSRAKWGTAASGFWFLSIWMSPVTLAFGLVIVAAESLRDRVLDIGGSLRLLGSRLAPLFVGVLPAIGAKRLHRAYALRHEIYFQESAIEIDLEHWRENVSALVALVHRSPWGWMAIACLVACLALGVAIALRWRERALVESWLVALTSSALGWACFAANAIVSWPRLNGYSTRYMALAHFFWTFGVAAVLVALGAAWRALEANRTRAQVVMAGLFLAPTLLVPQGGNARYEALVRAAKALETKAPEGSLLVGGYWGSYVFTSLQRNHPMVPVTEENAFARTGWTLAELPRAKEVVVSHAESERFGSAQAPAPWTVEHGVYLTLATPRWLVEEPYVFSLYRNESARAARGIQFTAEGGTVSAPDGVWPIVRIGARTARSTLLDVAFTPRHDGTLMLLFTGAWNPTTLAVVRSEAVDANGAIVPIADAHFDVRQLRIVLPPREVPWTGFRFHLVAEPPPDYWPPAFRGAFFVD